MSEMFAMTDVTVCYDNVEAVRNVSLAVEEGQIVTVIGPNGAGKTTLLMAAIGLLASRGRIVFGGRDISRMSVEDRVERRLCLVPEKRELFSDMSVADNLLLGQTRADAIRTWLIAHGVPAGRIIAISRGAADQIAGGNSANRRATVRVIDPRNESPGLPGPGRP